MTCDLLYARTHTNLSRRMADMTYNTSSFPALLRTLASLLGLSTSHHDRDDEVGNDAGDDLGGQGQGRANGEVGHEPLVLQG